MPKLSLATFSYSFLLPVLRLIVVCSLIDLILRRIFLPFVHVLRSGHVPVRCGCGVRVIVLADAARTRLSSLGDADADAHAGVGAVSAPPHHPNRPLAARSMGLDPINTAPHPALRTQRVALRTSTLLQAHTYRARRNSCARNRRRRCRVIRVPRRCLCSRAEVGAACHSTISYPAPGYL